MTTAKHSICIVCGGPLSTIINGVYDNRLGIDRFCSIAACVTCGIEQTIPVISKEELQALYEKHYNFAGENNRTYARLRALFFASPVYKIWMLIDGDISFHTKHGSGRILDVGCNEGRGLMFYRRSGFTVEGLEPNRKAAAIARSQGFDVHAEFIDDFFPPEPYDVIVLSNVLEHSLDPKLTLFHVRRLLKPGGEVWISCPNNKSWLRMIFRKSWINWHVPFHIAHFSRSSLVHLLSLQGFTITGIKNETPALWVAQSVISSLFAHRGYKTRLLRNPFVIGILTAMFRGVLFPFFWIGNKFRMGDCLIVTAKKVAGV
jgi:2-polyprenyl-3-methyl-5-hydroxy-6-metoxy-1,4-benzoquinol methylase